MMILALLTTAVLAYDLEKTMTQLSNDDFDTNMNAILALADDTEESDVDLECGGHGWCNPWDFWGCGKDKDCHKCCLCEDLSSFTIELPEDNFD